jgi:hypothetical protein
LAPPSCGLFHNRSMMEEPFLFDINYDRFSESADRQEIRH